MSNIATVSGGEELRANIRRFKKNWTEAQARVLLKVGQKVLDKALARVPFDQGDLYDSGHLEVSPKGQSVSVVFDAEHAIPVHEHLSQFSPPSWKTAEAEGRPVQWTTPGTGPKYLETPWKEEADSYLEDVGEDLQVERVGLG